MKTGWILWNQETISADRPSSSGTMKAIRRPSTECECRWLGSPVDFLLMNSRQINREKKIYLFVASFPHRCSPSSFLETKEFILQWSKSSGKETRQFVFFWFHTVLYRTTNRSMVACSRSEKGAFMLAWSSKLSFFVCSCSLEVRIRVRCSEMFAKHINVRQVFPSIWLWFKLQVSTSAQKMTISNFERAWTHTFPNGKEQALSG